MGRLFGTDGVRGVAGEDLTSQLAMDLATAAAGMLYDMRAATTVRSNGARLVAVVGRDPRVSGEFLEAAVVAGLAGAGVDVLRLGVIPTPGVAYLTAALGADLGVMLSASHNPAPDNGIKLFARGGFKLPDAAEDEIEARMAASPGMGLPAGGFGRVRDATGEHERYLAHLLGSRPGTGELGAAREAPGTGPLAGLRVVVDCAHGAASALAPELLRRAGAEVMAIGAEPDGENINADCGSMHLEALSAAVTKHGADAGIAHDGDADRCLAVDAAGEIIDGDQILAILTLELKARGQLAGDTVVATVMSNLGFRKAMTQAGITVVETAVGDRYVLEAMRAGALRDRRRAVRAHHHARARHHGRRHAHRAAPARGRRRPADRAGGPGPGDDAIPAGAGKRRRGEQGTRRQVARTGRRGRRGPDGTRRGGPRAGPAERHRAGRAGHGRGRRARARPAPRRRPGRDDPLPAVRLIRSLPKARRRNGSLQMARSAANIRWAANIRSRQWSRFGARAGHSGTAAARRADRNQGRRLRPALREDPAGIPA